MKHQGHLLLPGETGHGLKVDLLLDKAHVEVVSESESLGKWKYTEVVTTSLSNNRFDLQLASEQLVFTPSDAAKFVETGLPLLLPPSEGTTEIPSGTPKRQQQSWRDRFSDALFAPLGARVKAHQENSKTPDAEPVASDPEVIGVDANPSVSTDEAIEIDAHDLEVATTLDRAGPPLPEPGPLESTAHSGVEVAAPEGIEPDRPATPDPTSETVEAETEQAFARTTTAHGPLDAALMSEPATNATNPHTQPVPMAEVSDLGPLAIATKSLGTQPSEIVFIEDSDLLPVGLPERQADEPKHEAPQTVRPETTIAEDVQRQESSSHNAPHEDLEAMPTTSVTTPEESGEPAQREASAKLTSAVGMAESSLTPMPQIVARLQRGIVDLQEHRITVEEAHALAELAQAMCRTVQTAAIRGEDG